MCEHVVRGHDIGVPVLGGDCIGRLPREEAGNRRDALAARRLADFACGVDAEDAAPAVAEELEQSAVVRADLDHEPVLRAREAADYFVGVLPEMAHEGWRGPRYVDVMFEQHLRIHDVE